MTHDTPWALAGKEGGLLVPRCASKRRRPRVDRRGGVPQRLKSCAGWYCRGNARGKSAAALLPKTKKNGQTATKLLHEYAAMKENCNGNCGT